MSNLGPQHQPHRQPNPHYWRKGLPYLDQITFKPISEAQTMYDTLVSGDIDLIETSATRSRPSWPLGRHSQIQLVYSPGETEEASVMLNTEVAPLNELSVRQAMAYATDLQS